MTGLKKLDNYQNFAKAFRFADYTAADGLAQAQRRAAQDRR